MFRRALVFYLVVAMFAMGIVPPLDAGFIPSEMLGTGDSRAGDIEKVRVVLENRLVIQRLHDLGFTPHEVMARVSAMSDDQVHAVAQKLDEVNIGGELGVIIAVLVIVVLVLLILRLTGHGHTARR